MAAGTYKLSYEWMSKTDRENYSIVLSTGTAATTVVQTLVDRNDVFGKFLSKEKSIQCPMSIGADKI